MTEKHTCYDQNECKRYILPVCVLQKVTCTNYYYILEGLGDQ